MLSNSIIIDSYTTARNEYFELTSTDNEVITMRQYIIRVSHEVEEYRHIIVQTVKEVI